MPALNQADGIHPNAQGAAIVADTVWNVLRPLLDQMLGLMIELRGVSKTVPSGTGTLTILHPLDLARAGAAVVAITGPSGSGKSTLLGLLAGLDAPSTGSIVDRRRRHHDARRRRARAAARHAHRVRLPVLPPAAVADRVRERARADGDRRRERRAARGDGAARRSRALPSAAITTRRSSRAASSSASRSRARSPTIRRSCSPTSRPAISTARPATRSSSSCSTSIERAGRRSCWSRTIRSWRRWPTWRSRCATGASSRGREVGRARLESGSDR